MRGALAMLWLVRATGFVAPIVRRHGRAMARSAESVVEPSSSVRSPPIDLYTLRPRELEALVVGEFGAPRYRAKQLSKWMYERGAAGFDEMVDLPKGFRAQLAARATLGGTLALAREEVSARDGTVKRAYALRDGQLIESVLMAYDDGRRTACVSSQAGCAMGCTFCATGQMGFARQLTEAEIFEQVQRYSAELRARGERLSGLVMMGMGEPLANWRAVSGALARVVSELGVGARHITVSTVGLAPRIRALAAAAAAARAAADGADAGADAGDVSLHGIGLAVSLHSVDDAARSAVMPVNRRWPVAELLAACKEYVDASGRRITFEWALIAGENDDAATARALAARLVGAGLKGKCHVNVIPLNPTKKFGGAASSRRAVDGFIAELEARGVPATIRVRRGIDIDAGCGQLKAKVLEKDERAAAAASRAAPLGDPTAARLVQFEEAVQAYDVARP